jgi:Tol biopolymer transport system component
MLHALGGLLLLSAQLMTSNVAAAPEEALLTNVRQLTFEGKRAGEGYFSADGSRMVFQSERESDNPFYQIYLMDLETGDVERVSPGHGKTTCAWIHPSQNRVMYASTHDDPAARDKMRDEIEFRASGQERRYSWDYDERFDIYTQDLATGTATNLTKTLGYDAEGSYSPDGRQITFASNRRAYDGSMSDADAEIFAHDPAHMMDLYIMDADGSNLRRLTTAPGYDGGPFFSPDGRHITWRRFSIDGATAEIYTMNLATGEERALTQTGVMSWAPYYHPSGDYLIYASNREGFANFELFLVDALGRSEPVRVTHTQGFDGLPVFAPDGATLAWTSNRTATNQSQIFRASWNDQAARRALGLDRPSTGTPALDGANATAQTASGITVEDARLHVERLTADSMDGRLTGTQGESLATAYVAEQFEALGLAPGGDDGNYFQAFPFTAGASLGKDNDLRVTDVPGLVVDRDWRPLALSRNGPIRSAPVVFAGYGIVAPAGEGFAEYDSYGDLDVTDKWVMVLRYQPEDVSPEQRRHFLRFSDLAYKASWAKRQGALGMIVVTGPQAAAKSELVPIKMDASTATTSLAAISVTDAVAEHLLRPAGKTLADVQQELDAGEPITGFDIPGIEVSAALDIVKERRSGRNVIGVLAAGESRAGAPVVIGAHVDHLGRGQASGSLARDHEQGRIHPGADDNASGVAGLLEAAEYLADLRSRDKLGAKRDIVFIAWSGEELGTLGSGHYVDALSESGPLNEHVSAYLNLDMIGRMQEKAYLQGAGSSSVWAREIERRNVPVGLAVSITSDPYLPTDSTPFYLKGVPVLTAFSGVHEEYSTPRDTPGLINYDGLRDIARLMTGIARSLARSEEAPDYIEVERARRGAGRTSMRVYLGTIPAYGEEEGLVGVRLQGAVKGSPAEQAGIEQEDVLIGLAGVEIETIYDFVTALGGLRAGEETQMIVIRSGERVMLTVTPAVRE